MQLTLTAMRPTAICPSRKRGSRRRYQTVPTAWCPAPPSPNGDGGEQTARPPSRNGEKGRDSKGRFARGNKGGPGNPFARRVGRLRSQLLNLVTEADLQEVARKLVEQARTGNLVATRLLLVYLIGRPAET